MMPNVMDPLAGRPVLLPDPADLIDVRPHRPRQSSRASGLVARVVHISRMVLSLLL
jgi:hypothetical protein